MCMLVSQLTLYCAWVSPPLHYTAFAAYGMHEPFIIGTNYNFTIGVTQIRIVEYFKGINNIVAI